MLKTLDYTIRIGSTQTFLFFDFYLYFAYAALYVCVSSNVARILEWSLEWSASEVK